MSSVRISLGVGVGGTGDSVLELNTMRPLDRSSFHISARSGLLGPEDIFGFQVVYVRLDKKLKIN